MLAGTVLALAAIAAQETGEVALPPPTGPHGVGTALREWTDPDRPDSLLPGAPDRVVVLRVWYPARVGSGAATAAYIPQIGDPGAVDESVREYLSLHDGVRTNGVLDAPFEPGAGPAPVIVFSTGRSQSSYDYTALSEELASHGFVVVSVDSPHMSRVFRADGSFLPARSEWAPNPSIYQPFERADAFFEPMNGLVADDLAFVLRRIDALARAGEPVWGELDLARLAMMGHSSGAMAGSRACAREPLCTAFLGIEGTQTREVRTRGVDKPYGILISERSLEYDSENVYRELLDRSLGTFRVYRVGGGAGHNSFTDVLLIRPGLFDYEMEPARGVAITRAVVRDFMHRHVGGPPAEGAPEERFSSIRVEVRPREGGTSR